MGKTWLVSDTHFGHFNIIRYCNRPFKDLNHMNEVLIEKWNKKVSPDDTVIHAGDFCLGNPSKYFERLNGNIQLVRGNHDVATFKWLKENPQKNVQTFDKDIHLNILGKDVLINHYPIWQIRYFRKEPYDILLYGHVHNGNESKQGPKNTKNVSIEVMNYEPQELEIVVDTIMKLL